MGRRNVDDELQKDVIVDIPKDQEHRFGCSGRMLNPSRASGESLVKKVPCGMVITTPFLRNALAESHNAQVTCLFLTKRAMMAVGEDAGTKVPLWRVVTANGEMIGFYPSGGAEQAKLLDTGIPGAIGQSRQIYLGIPEPRYPFHDPPSWSPVAAASAFTARRSI